MNKEDIKKMIFEDEEGQSKMWFRKDELLKYGSQNYWSGIIIGASFILVLCLVIGWLI